MNERERKRKMEMEENKKITTTTTTKNMIREHNARYTDKFLQYKEYYLLRMNEHRRSQYGIFGAHYFIMRRHDLIPKPNAVWNNNISEYYMMMANGGIHTDTHTHSQTKFIPIYIYKPCILICAFDAAYNLSFSVCWTKWESFNEYTGEWEKNT